MADGVTPDGTRGHSAQAARQGTAAGFTGRAGQTLARRASATRRLDRQIQTPEALHPFSTGSVTSIRVAKIRGAPSLSVALQVVWTKYVAVF